MKKYLIIFFFCLITQSGFKANIINVPGSYSTIQAAINSSSNGDTVLVEAGTYYENINFRGRKIVLTSRFYLTNDPATIWGTVINGSNPSHADTGSCVIINNNEDSTTVLQGFTLTGGSGTKWNDEHFAGIYREGGGLLIQYSSPIIQYNIIHNNQITNISGVSSTGGAGIRIGDSYPRIYNNIIMNNTARYGAGVVLNYTGCEMKNNIICVNYGSFQYNGGSAIWAYNNFTRPKIIVNNTIVYNSAGNGSGGIATGGTSTNFKNNVIWGNTSPTNVQILGSGASVTYCNVQGGYTGAGNINVDPQFADSNYYLASGSPCIDKGDSSTIYNDPEDPNSPGNALWPAKGTLRNDMGAYGGPMAKILTNILIGLKQTGITIPKKFVLYQNFPNPFNPVTKIRFEIPSVRTIHELPLKMKIYDIGGREIATILDKQLEAGSYEIEWDASGYTSGVYFYRLTAGDFSETRKTVLLK